MKYKVITEKDNYKAASVLDAEDHKTAMLRALEQAALGEERVVSVTPVKFGIWCVRTAGSVLGPAETWLTQKGKRVEFDTPEEATTAAELLNKDVTSTNLAYSVKELD